MRDVQVNQTRVADHAAPEFVGLDALRRTREERRAQRGFDLAQRLRRAWLRERHFVGGAMQRTVIVKRDQEAQLLEPQARGDGIGIRQHG